MRRWDYSVFAKAPQEGDLLVISDKSHEYYNRVMRLNLSDDSRRTITVGTDLVSGYGLNVMVDRRDVRPITSRDTIMVIEK